MTFLDVKSQIDIFLSNNQNTVTETGIVIADLEEQITSDTLVKLQTAQSQLGDVLDAIQAIQTRLNTLLDYLTTTPATLNGYKNAIDAFGVILAVASGVNPTEWDEGNGIRVEEVYGAITAIINKLASEYAASRTVTDAHRIEAILLFQDAFGGVNLILTDGSNPVNAQAYATTNSTTSMTLWLDPVPVIEEARISPGVPLHTADNLIHEFGHLLDLRVASVNGNLYADWEAIRIDFSRRTADWCFVQEDGTEVYGTSSERGFTLTEGFVDGDTKRQNRQPRSDFSGACGEQLTDSEICSSPTLADNSLCQEFEIERIADMFLYWVRHYGFTPAPDRRGPAMDAYVNGMTYVRSSDNMTVAPAGFFSWMVTVAEGV